MLNRMHIRNIKNVTYYGYDEYRVKNIIFTVSIYEYDELMEDLKEFHKLSNSSSPFSNKCAFDIQTDEGNITVSWYDNKVHIGVGLRKLH